MKTYVQEGRTLTLPAPSGGVVSGVGYKIGDLFVVASANADEGDEFEGDRLGVFDLAAETHASTQAADIGDVAYYDATNHRITVTPTGNTAVGVFTAAKASTAAVARIVLTPQIFSIADEIVMQPAIADIALGAVAGVDGTGGNAASKTDVDARMTTINNKVNAIITALEGSGVIAT